MLFLLASDRLHLLALFGVFVAGYATAEIVRYLSALRLSMPDVVARMVTAPDESLDSMQARIQVELDLAKAAVKAIDLHRGDIRSMCQSYWSQRMHTAMPEHIMPIAEGLFGFGFNVGAKYAGPPLPPEPPV